MKDKDVPWTTVLKLQEKLIGDDVETILVKNADHRLSEPQDLKRLTETLDYLLDKI